MPAIESGFMDIMVNKYGDTEEHAKEILSGFMQVIIDSQNYSFSLNHSQSYSYIGYVCAWLKYYYPVEFLTAMLNSTPFSKKEKISEIMSLAKKKKVRISPIKFGKSRALYEPDTGTRSIYKGLDSISNLNERVAEELYQVAKRQNYESFSDLLIEIIRTTSANSTQLTNLIRLDYFSDFGAKEILLRLYEFIGGFFNKNLKEATQEKRITWIKVIERKLFAMPYQKVTLQEQIEFERSALGYIVTTFPTVPESLFYVVEINKQYTPRISLYRLQDGEESLMKMKKGDYYVRKTANSLYEDTSAIFEGDVIQVIRVDHEWGKKLVDGKWTDTENVDTFIKDVKIIRPSNRRKLVEFIE